MLCGTAFLRNSSVVCSHTFSNSSPVNCVTRINFNSDAVHKGCVDIFQQAQSRLGPFPNAIICGPSCKSLAQHELMGWPPKRLSLFETGSPAHTRTRLAHSSDLEPKSQLRLPRQSDSRDAPSISQWYGHKELTPLLRSHSLGQICTSHPPTNDTNRACLPPQQLLEMWQHHAPTISLKLKHFLGDFGNYFRHITQLLSGHTSSLTSDHHVISSCFGHISYKIFTFRLIPTKTNIYRLATQNNLKKTQRVQIFSATLTVIDKESNFNVEPTKIYWVTSVAEA